MKKKLFATLIILYTFFLQISTVSAEPEEIIEEEKVTVEAYFDDDGKIVPPELLCEGAVLMNADTGEVLFEKNMNKRLYPASTTKVMTAILTLENGDFNDIVTFSRTACDIEPGSSSIGMKPNEVLTLDEALNGMMVHSANEVANALAEYVSGDIGEFAKLMTSRAKELGANNTSFMNPHGLHDENHYTTPFDLATIFRHGLTYPFFNEVIKTLYYQIPPTNITSEERNMYTKNRLIMQNSQYYYPPCGGGKTGFTDEAMHTLVTHAEKDGVHLIAAVMKAPPNGTYTDSMALYEYGFNFFRTERIFDRYSYSKEIPVVQTTDAEKGEKWERGIVLAQADKGISKMLRKDVLEKGFRQEIELPDELEAPIEKGDKLGTLTLYSDNEEIGSVGLFALNSVYPLSVDEVKEIKKEEFIAEQKERIPIYLAFVPAVILAIALVLSAVVRIIRIRKRNKSRFSGSRNKYRLR